MIESYRFGRITIDGKDYCRDLIVFPDHIMEDWWREEGHLLKTGDIEEVLAFRPDVLVIGQGAFGRMRVADQVRRSLKERNIELITDKTDAAKDAFNRVAGECKKVVAALHLTC
jgi:hypothetical protein